MKNINRRKFKWVQSSAAIAGFARGVCVMFLQKTSKRWGRGLEGAVYTLQSTATALVRWLPCCPGLSHSLKISPDSADQRYIKYPILFILSRSSFVRSNSHLLMSSNFIFANPSIFTPMIHKWCNHHIRCL